MISRQDFCKWIAGCDRNALKNARKRTALANNIANLTDFWSSDEMMQFIDEMRGLDFYKSEDRALFCELFFSWVQEGADESFNA